MDFIFPQIMQHETNNEIVQNSAALGGWESLQDPIHVGFEWYMKPHPTHMYPNPDYKGVLSYCPNQSPLMRSAVFSAIM
jgi:hypothetical protein